jgi:hypothetical protein
VRRLALFGLRRGLLCFLASLIGLGRDGKYVGKPRRLDRSYLPMAYSVSDDYMRPLLNHITTSSKGKKSGEEEEEQLGDTYGSLICFYIFYRSRFILSSSLNTIPSRPPKSLIIPHLFI